jgi:disulfide bond formation protein DsbB
MASQSLTNAVSTALAALAVLLQILVVLVALLALISLASSGARRLLAEVRDTLLGSELWIAWVIALTATLGSLYFSELAKYVPCHLCWYQRIAMYPMAVILLVGALRRDVRAGVQYAFLFPIVGALISIYHIYLEENPSAQPAGCKVGGTTCATKWIDKFGYITIPMLALTAFAAILTLLLFAWSRRDAGATGTPPPDRAAEATAAPV